MDEYQEWVERVIRGGQGKPLNPGEVVKSADSEPYKTIEFAKVTKANFSVELGKKGDQYIYHFYPAEKYLGSTASFYEPMSAAFIQVFQRPEQVEAVWIEEMKSWAVRVLGFVNTVWGDELATRVIDAVEEKLGQ